MLGAHHRMRAVLVMSWDTVFGCSMRVQHDRFAGNGGGHVERNRTANLLDIGHMAGLGDRLL